MAAIARHVPKPDAVAILAEQAGLSAGDPYGPEVGATIARLPRLMNGHVEWREADLVPGAERVGVMQAVSRWLAPPRFLNGRPAWFPDQPRMEESPPFGVLRLADGCIAQVARAPLVLANGGALAVRDYSSRFAGLVHGYDADLRQIVADARRVPGTAIVLCDDIHPINYSHWMLDALPRLACLGERRDAFVVTTDERPAFKREALRLCGFRDEQVIHLGDFRAVRAETLVVPGDLARMPHPAHKAAPWALDFLRSRIGFAALARYESHSLPLKLYISRNDSPSRRVLNEDALMQVLGPAGYERVTLADRGVAEQVALFARATHVVGLHGAGLTNFAFAPVGARLLEIFPRTYGTPAYYVLAAGQGLGYAAFVAQDIEPGGRSQADDVRVDVAEFARVCGAVL